MAKPLPASLTKDLKLAFIKPTAKVMASSRRFTPHGQSGLEFSDFLPRIGENADEICMLRSMHTEAFNHHPGQSLLMSGSPLPGRPTIGAWTTYGLGSESRDLPAFVVTQFRTRRQRRVEQLVERIPAVHLSGRRFPQQR